MMLCRIISTYDYDRLEKTKEAVQEFFGVHQAKRKLFDLDSEYIAANGRTIVLLTGEALQNEHIGGILETVQGDLAGQASPLNLIVIDEMHRCCSCDFCYLVSRASGCLY